MDGQQIRATLLDVVNEYASGRGYSLQRDTVLEEASRRLNIRGSGQERAQQALLTVWSDLFREGYLAWGTDINNVKPPFCHVTDRGRTFLRNVSHDPANPDGYLHYLASHVSLNPIANSYIAEAVRCYNNMCYKATAVMIGCAAESVVLEVRDTLRDRLISTGKIGSLSSKEQHNLDSWMIKTVLDTISTIIGGYKAQMDRSLAEAFATNWPGLTGNIRVIRNDAGHPTNVDPVTPEMVHAALLMFTFQAQLAANLIAWVPQGIA